MSEIWDGGCIDCLRREMLNRSPFSTIACVSTTPLIQSEFDKCCWLEEDSPGILHGNFENGLIFLRHCLHGNSVCNELESHYPADTWASAVPFETPPGGNEGHRDSPSLWFIYSVEAKGQIMIPAHQVSSNQPSSAREVKQVQQCMRHVNYHF